MIDFPFYPGIIPGAGGADSFRFARALPLAQPVVL